MKLTRDEINFICETLKIARVMATDEKYRDELVEKLIVMKDLEK